MPIVQNPSMPCLSLPALVFFGNAVYPTATTPPQIVQTTKTPGFDSERPCPTATATPTPTPYPSPQPSTHIPPCPLMTLRCFSTASFASKNLSTQFCMHGSSFLSKPLDEMAPVTHFFQQMSVSSCTAAGLGPKGSLASSQGRWWVPGRGFWLRRGG